MKILSRIIYSKSHQLFLFSDQIYVSINFKIHYLHGTLYRRTYKIFLRTLKNNQCYEIKQTIIFSNLLTKYSDNGKKTLPILRFCHHFLTEKVVLLSYDFETIRKAKNISLNYFSITEKINHRWNWIKF